MRSTEAAWDRTAAKYALALESDIEFLRGGGISLCDIERNAFGDLRGCGRVIHLQCSYGLDALSMLNLGASEVVGVDISGAMLALAEKVSTALQARAQWVKSPVLTTPASLNGTADLVYTGKGAIPWVDNLAEWGRVVARLLRPGGRFYLYEGHPLNWVWDASAKTHRLSADGRGYFDRDPRANENFPAAAVERYTPAGEIAPLAWEFQWTLADVITALCEAGLVIERVQEHPEQFWPLVREIPEAEMRRLPHSFSVLAKAKAE